MSPIRLSASALLLAVAVTVSRWNPCVLADGTPRLARLSTFAVPAPFARTLHPPVPPAPRPLLPLSLPVRGNPQPLATLRPKPDTPLVLKRVAARLISTSTAW